MRVLVFLCATLLALPGFSQTYQVVHPEPDLEPVTAENYVFMTFIIINGSPRGSYFSCTKQHKRDAMTMAENNSMAKCQDSAYPRCKLRGSRIIIDGFIGVFQGTYYGYGCVAEAQVRGHH